MREGKRLRVQKVAVSVKIPFPPSHFGFTETLLSDTLTQWFPKCSPRISQDLRPVPGGSVDTFM
jgi:hypothetical protein